VTDRTRRRRTAAAALGAVLVLAALNACTSDPSALEAEFVVAVAGETFVLRTSDAETIRLAADNLAGRNTRFPLGPLRRGDGGFNRPWSWHFDPDRVRMVEVAIEVCDGRPTYVESHLDDFLPAYCPWGAQVIAEL
jgi:hypothetical protein